MNPATTRVSSMAVAVLAVAALVLSSVADAARVGGGRSLGAQRPSVAPKMAAPPSNAPAAAAPSTAAPGAATQPVMPATPGATLPARPAAPAAAAAPTGASRWLAPIAGIAAGLGLAALLSHFGLPEGLGTILLIALVAFAGFFALRYLLARRGATQRPYAYAGPGNATPPASFEMPRAPSYAGDSRVEPVLSPAPATAVAANALPAGFDAESFVRHAKQQFIRLQSAHDRGDRKVLSEVLTPEMYAEVTLELDGREPRPPAEVVTLGGEVLEVATEGDRHWASVRFTGTMRESGTATPVAFDEVWNLSKPIDGSSGWLLAGIQQPA